MLESAMMRSGTCNSKADVGLCDEDTGTGDNDLYSMKMFSVKLYP